MELSPTIAPALHGLHSQPPSRLRIDLTPCSHLHCGLVVLGEAQPPGLLLLGSFHQHHLPGRNPQAAHRMLSSL